MALHLLSARQVQTASAGDYQDGGCLCLRVSENGASWFFRFTAPDKRRREMGLGGAERGTLAAAGASLAQAREAAARARTMCAAGLDPIEHRNSLRSAAQERLIAAKRAAEAERTTLARVARKYHEAVIEPQKTAKHSAQWIASLEQGVPPSIWHAPIDGIRPVDLLEALAKLQARVPETAARVRQRLEVIFEDAIFHELCKENPARIIRRKLADRPRARDKGNFAALPFPEIPEFLARLRKQPGVASLALQFTLLTAARTAEVLGASWDEFDAELTVWRVPASRMKAREEHKVYLSDAAKAVLQQMRALSAAPYVFPSLRSPQVPLSNMAMLTVLRRMKLASVTTVHGLRSSFSTWANDTGAARPDVIEACLAHREADKVRAAYNHASFAAERKRLLALWADHCAGNESMEASASVLPFRDLKARAASGQPEQFGTFAPDSWWWTCEGALEPNPCQLVIPSSVSYTSPNVRFRAVQGDVEVETGLNQRPRSDTAGAVSMADTVGEFDWGRTALGPANLWPQSLRSALSICLSMPTVAALYWGPEFIVIYNDAYAPALAERHPAALGRPLSQVWPEIWDVLGPQMAQVVQTGQAFAITDQPLTMYRRGRAEQTFWSYSFTPVQGENEAQVGVFVAAMETTALVQATQRMSLQVQRQQRLFTNAPGFIAILEGPEHSFEFVNNAYIQLFGKRTVGAPVRDVFPELEGQGFFELLDEVYRSGVRYVAQGASVRIEPKDGSPPRTVLVDFIYEPIRSEDDHITGIFCQGYDVTERVLAERDRDSAIEELRSADKNKDDVLAKLAHEIRNPLSPIKFAIQAMRRVAVQGDARHQRLLEIIERQTGAISGLVEDLMDVSQVRLGKVRLTMEEVALQDVVQQAVEACSPSAIRNSQELTLDMPRHPVYVQADRKRMVQVCCNVIGNSVKFTGNGGRINISLSENESAVRIAVTDTGVGMSAETVEKVFGLFTQGPASNSREAVGLGIGLSLVKELVELHGGAVSARSAGVGLGSTFELQIPKALSAGTVNLAQY